jgi:hypothetical protein
METQVRTPQMVFMRPQRLVVPLFQRPYVWNEENQWEPLWNDVVRVTDRVLNGPLEKHHPHFSAQLSCSRFRSKRAMFATSWFMAGWVSVSLVRSCVSPQHEPASARAHRRRSRISDLLSVSCERGGDSEQTVIECVAGLRRALRNPHAGSRVEC